jgi:putative endonuclease
MKKELQTSKPWTLYLLECKDGSLYAGITNDLEKRLATHNAGQGAKYTRGRRPVRLIVSQPVESHSVALQMEAQLKKLPKSKKVGFFN